MKKIKLVLFPLSTAFLLILSTLMCIEKGRSDQNKSAQEQEDRNLIQSLFQDKHYDFAAKEADNYLTKYPEGTFIAEILFIRAQLYVIKEFFNSALFTYKQVIKRYPESVYYQDSLYFSGILSIELGETKTGEHYFKLLQKAFPQNKRNSQLEYYFGKIAFKEKSWKNAETMFQQSLNNSLLTQNQKLEAENYLAWSYYFQGKKKSANGLFLKLLESDINSVFKARISFHLAQEAYKNDKYEKAAYWWGTLLKKWPHSDLKNKSQFWLAETLYLIHKQSSSKLSSEQKRKAVNLYSKNLSSKKPIEIVMSHYHRAWFFLALNQPYKAELDLKWLHENKSKYENNIDINLLGIEIIRAYYKSNNCQEIVKSKKKNYFSDAIKKSESINYHIGKCRFKQKHWSKAKREFEQISLRSQFGALMFSDYLEIFYQTNDLAGGLSVLKNAVKYPELGSKEKILMSKTEFCLKFKKWLMAIDSMEQILKISPRNKKDPWFLMDIASSYRLVVKAYEDKNWRKRYSQLKPLKFYQEQTATYYEKSYYQLPNTEIKTRLSILIFLAEYYEKEKKVQKATTFYQKAIPLIGNQERKNKLQLRLAKLLINYTKKIREAKNILFALHNKANKKINYEASSLLAEVLIQQKQYRLAITTLNDLSKQPIHKNQLSAKVHYRLGELYQFKEEWKNALRHYRLVVKSPYKTPLKKQAEKHMTNIRHYLEQLGKAKDKKASS